MENEDTKEGISGRKLEANRENAQKSTGPTTQRGKNVSRWNAIKHGILASRLVIQEGEGKENLEDFGHLLQELQEDWEPIGILEEMLVERIAVLWWRLRRVIECESGEIRRGYAYSPDTYELANHPFEDEDLGGIRAHLAIPRREVMDRILRYETTINRQLFQAMNQLERLQRQRKGEAIPAPISVDVTRET